MKEGNIFLDFDNTKFNTNPMFRDYFNERYRIQSELKDYANNPDHQLVLRKYLPAGACPTEIEYYQDIRDNLFSSIERHDTVHPVEGMAETILLLAERYKIWIVTAREKSSMPVIEHLINKHIPGSISGIHCVWDHKGNGIHHKTSKIEFVWNIEGKKIAFLDDSVKEVLEMQTLIPSYLFDPAGINDHIKDIQHRVRSMKEFGKLFL